MPRFKGVVSHQKSGTGKNKDRQRTTPRNNRCFICNDCHLKSNELSLPVISVSPPLNNPVINPYHLSLVRQQSSSSSYNTPCDNLCFNIKDSNSNSNELPSPVIPVLPPLNDSVINPTQLSLVCQHSSSSSHNTMHELQASSIHGRTSPDSSNNMPPPSTKNGSRNVYGCMFDVSKLTPSQRQQHAIMSLHHYHEFCNTKDPS